MQKTIYTKQFLDNVISELQLAFDRFGKINIIAEYPKNMKTKKQLGFIFGGLVDTIRVFWYDTQGEVITANQIKEDLYDELGVFEAYQSITGKKKFSCKTLSKMTTIECFDFTQKVIEFIDDVLIGCIITPDLRYTWTRYIEPKDINILAQQAKNWNKEQKEYLDYIRQQPCINCGVVHQSEAHHLRNTDSSGVGIKAEDYYTIGLCNPCHRLLHDTGEVTTYKPIEDMLSLSMADFCLVLFNKWYNKR